MGPFREDSAMALFLTTGMILAAGCRNSCLVHYK